MDIKVGIKGIKIRMKLGEEGKTKKTYDAEEKLDVQQVSLQMSGSR